ncbi:hypothetical protein [Pseudoprimorskyibacter insulae]|uniref:hypothetical protein n=1 Tax=Pseudoprimorskyibacter insulae TaxID=1695997 RepID=UPI000D560D60|nr:hypothetical protein [Pseudoprimorskyibacter insulae]
MNSIATWCGAIGAIALNMIYPQESVAEGLTAKDFLVWDEPSQNSFLFSSVGMAAAIASQTKPELAQCLNDWYFGDKTNTRNGEILDFMGQYGGYHPTTVILAVVENACGEFG